MSKNKKKGTTAVGMGGALLGLLICALLGSAGVGYVWLKNELYVLSRDIKEEEARLDGLRRKVEVLSQTAAALESVGALDQRVRDMRLGLNAPQPDQIVRLTEWEPAATRIERVENPKLLAEKRLDPQELRW